MYQQPEYQQPAYQQPEYQQPVYQQPVYPQPVAAAPRQSGKGRAVLLVLAALLLLMAVAVAVVMIFKEGGFSGFFTDRSSKKDKTDGAETSLSESVPEKEDPYYEVEAQCSALKEQGDLIGAVLYAQEASAGETDSRYASLLAQYEAELVSDTLAASDELADSGKYRLALQRLYQVQQSYDCQEFADASVSYKKQLGKHTVAAGLRYSAAVNPNGTVKIAGTAKKDRTPANTSSWSNVISVAVGDSHIIGLRDDGTVLGTGPVEYHYTVSTWTDIVAIAVGETHSVGLKADGTVVAVGDNFKGECDPQGLYTDSPIIAIAAGYEYTVALHLDGTVTTVGGNTNGQCNVSGWRDIESIAAGTFHTLGVTSDGRVLAAGSNLEGQCNVGAWTGIAAVSAGDYFSMGLRRDGTVVAVGMNGSGQCNVGSWRNIVDIAGGNYQALGMDVYGDLVSVGGNQVKQRDFTN